MIGTGSGSRSVVVTVVVRGKGDCDAFLAKFWESWRGRAWENEAAGPSDQSGSVSGSGSGSGSGLGSGGMYSKDGTVRMVGVSGILRKEQEMWESTDKSLQDAFQDLNALMVILLNSLSCCLILLDLSSVYYILFCLKFVYDRIVVVPF